MTEIANFAKFAVKGPGAEAWLDGLLANALPRTGRIALSPMLNEAGKLIGDFTVAKRGEDDFLVWGSSAAQIHHLRWFEAHLPEGSPVRVERLGMKLMGLMLAGPRSRAVLAALTDHDVSNAAFRFMDHRAMDVGGVPAMVNRLSYTGDLGYEIWVEPCYLRTLYRAVKAAGAAEGIVDFGMRALLSMRLEKNWPTWFAELRPIYGAAEGGMERFVRLSKDFVGRDAAVREAEDGPRLRRVSLAIEAENADVMGDEPIWARVGARLRRGAAGARHRRAAVRGRRDAGAGGGRAGRRRLAGGRLGDLGRLRAFGRRCRWRRATCRRRSPGARRRGSSRSRSSGCASRRGSCSSRRSIPTGRGCAADARLRSRRHGLAASSCDAQTGTKESGGKRMAKTARHALLVRALHREGRARRRRGLLRQGARLDGQDCGHGGLHLPSREVGRRHGRRADGDARRRRRRCRRSG